MFLYYKLVNLKQVLIYKFSNINKEKKFEYFNTNL